MNWILLSSTLILLFLSLILIILSFRLRKQLTETSKHLEQIEGEEYRLFDFLHILGASIEEDASPNKLYEVISDGLEEVTKADGAALYLLSEDRQSLIPKNLSKNCPPLLGIPVETLQSGNKASLQKRILSTPIEKGDGPLWHTIDAGESIHTSDLKSHPSFKDAFSHYSEDVSAMIAPLTHLDKDLGVLAVARLNGSSAPFTKNDFAVFCSMAEQSAFALGNAMIHQEAHEKRKLDAQLKNAQEVQRILLPSEHPQIPGYKIHGLNIPALLISGDYYDYLPLEEDLHGIAIADVSGKGIAAGLMMASCRSTLRSFATHTPSPAQALSRVNHHLAKDIREDMFISMAYLIIYPSLEGKGLITLARAGHDAPLFYHKKDNEVQTIKPPGLAIGLDQGPIFQRITRDLDLTLQPGDCLLLYTDGVNEAEDPEGQEYGKKRLHETFKKNAPRGAQAIIENLHQDVQAFAKGHPQQDDITLIAIEKI